MCFWGGGEASNVNLQQGNRLSLSTFFVRLEESQVGGQQENHVDTNIGDFSRGLKNTGLTWCVLGGSLILIPCGKSLKIKHFYFLETREVVPKYFV